MTIVTNNDSIMCAAETRYPPLTHSQTIEKRLMLIWSVTLCLSLVLHFPHNSNLISSRTHSRSIRHAVWLCVCVASQQYFLWLLCTAVVVTVFIVFVLISPRSHTHTHEPMCRTSSGKCDTSKLQYLVLLRNERNWKQSVLCLNCAPFAGCRQLDDLVIVIIILFHERRDESGKINDWNSMRRSDVSGYRDGMLVCTINFVVRGLSLCLSSFSPSFLSPFILRRARQNHRRADHRVLRLFI